MEGLFPEVLQVQQPCAVQEGCLGYRAPGREEVKCPGQVWKTEVHFPTDAANPGVVSPCRVRGSGAHWILCYWPPCQQGLQLLPGLMAQEAFFSQHHLLPQTGMRQLTCCLG